MPKVLVLYYSRTGNTQKMARAVAEGARIVAGVEVEVKYYAIPEELVNFDAIIIGIPTYHHDMTVDMKKLFEEAAVKDISLNNKVGGAFGSYGWSGEAPGLVLEIMKNKFGMNVVESPVLVKYAPDQAGLDKCRQFGKEIAERLMAKT